MTLKHAAILAFLLTAIACGGGGDSSTPTSPSSSPTPSPSPAPSPAGTTITITAAGVSPKELTVSIGARVTFVNNDSRPHEMNSDPHPEHGDCPPINDVGFISPGQSRETGNLVVARSCGYHDHNQDSNQALQGRIIVQ